MPTTTTTTVDKNAVARWNVAVWNNAVWVNAVKHAEAAKTKVRAASVALQPRPAAVSVPTDIASVMACIRAHESGNYDEHSHASGSSGAYQYEPQTWRTWFARWKDAVGTGPDGTRGYTFVEYAYEAPRWMQDAVTAYTLTHGGAGNWSDKFGNDPCTAGLPGGG